MAKAAERVRTILQTPSGPNIPQGASRSFIQLVKAIGEAGSNHEEDRVIRKEAKVLAAKMKETNINPRQMKEYLVRLMYCEMLGHESEFGYIHAVKLAQHASILEKRIGYLAVSVLLHEDHELMLLLTNTLQRDLKSSNVVEICTALTTIARVMNAEMIPAVLPLVEEKCNHPREIVRKKAILALHRFYGRSKTSISHVMDKIRKALCDSDPGVMAAALNVFYDLCRDNAMEYKDLVSTFVSILKQVIERRLPKDFDYHKVPAPWMQVKLLKILALLGEDDQSSSESMYEVIRECLQRAEAQGSAAYAVIYECLRTITKIYPSPELVELAANSIGRFLKADNNNLKYLGITALVAVVQVNAAYAAEHQIVVIDCLDDPDDTLKRKTLELLCKMTNPQNVTVITEKLVSYTKLSVDPYLRKDLVPRIVQLAERYAPDSHWFLDTMVTLLEYAGDLIHRDALNNVLSLIANPDSGEEADEELRLFAFESFIELLTRPKLSDMLIQAVCWVVGEYAYLAKDYDQEVVLEEVAALLDRPVEDKVCTYSWVVSALTKLITQTGLYPDSVRRKIEKLKNSRSVDLQQRAYELLRLKEQTMIMKAVLPLDSSSEDMDVDPNLGFLNQFVQTALNNGADAYIPREERESTIEDTTEVVDAEPTMKFDAYEKPKDIHASLFSGLGKRDDATPITSKTTIPEDSSLDATTDEPSQQTQKSTLSESNPLSLSAAAAPGGKRRWGKGGDLSKSATAAATPATTPTTTTTPPTAAKVTPEIEEDIVPTKETEPEKSVLTKVSLNQEPQPSPELERKQKEASLLFAGTAKTTTTTARSNKFKKKTFGAKTTATTSSTSTPSLVSEPTTTTTPSTTTTTGSSSMDLMGDLIGLDLGGPSTAPPPPATITSSSSAMGGDLLGDLFGPPSTSSVSTPTTTTPSLLSTSTSGLGSGSGSLLDGDLFAPSPTPTPTPTISNTSASPLDANPLMSVFGSSSMSSNMPSSEDPTQIPSSLQTFPHMMITTPLSKDSAIELTCAKIWKPEAFGLVLFLKNSSMESIQSIAVTLDVPSQLSPLDSTSSAFTLSVNGTSTVQKVLSYSTQTVATGMSIKGQYSYTSFGAPKKGFFSVTILAGDLTRKSVITTEQFGGLWESPGFGPSHRAQTVQSTVFKGPEEFIQGLASSLHLHAVQVIGTEAILCGQILANSNAKCLIHGKVNGSRVELSVRSTSAQYSQAVISQCVSTCTGS
eukprot:m.60127 g.60127  ORF g.60127 m.60127 type:complete len:1231 (-) comp22804_c1_seq1:183-3875(-)